MQINMLESLKRKIKDIYRFFIAKTRKISNIIYVTDEAFF